MTKQRKPDLEGHVSGQANRPLSNPAHALSPQGLAAEICTDMREGLSAGEASSRLEEYGPNELDDGPGVQPAKILLRQIANAMILVKRTISPTP